MLCNNNEINSAAFDYAEEFQRAFALLDLDLHVRVNSDNEVFLVNSGNTTLFQIILTQVPDDAVMQTMRQLFPEL